MSDGEHNDNYERDHFSADEDQGRDTQEMDDEDEEDYEDDQEYEDDEYEDDDLDEEDTGSEMDDDYRLYMENRYSPTSSDDSQAPPNPLANPFAKPAGGFPNVEPDLDNVQYDVVDGDGQADSFTNGPTINLSVNTANNRPQLGKITMPSNKINLNLGVGVSGFIDTTGGQSVPASGNQSVRDPHGHLASSPLIMNSQEAVSNFFSQYIPVYYARNPWLLSSTFEIHQYKDLKNLNLYIYKTLRESQKDDTNHPTQPRNIKMKPDLDWDLKIDRIASCYISKRLMTNVITYVSFPKDYDILGLYADERKMDLSPTTKSKRPRKHLLGVIKSTQTYTLSPSPLNSNRGGGMMANSVTHTPRTSGVGSALALSINKPGSLSNNNKIINNILLQSPNIDTLDTNGGINGLGINIKNPSNQPTPSNQEDYYSNDSDDDPQERKAHHQQQRIGRNLDERDKKSILEIYDKGHQDLEENHFKPYKQDRSCCNCWSIHNLRNSLIFGHNGCRRVIDAMVYTLFYQYGSVLAFYLIYTLILTLSICERVYFPILPYENQVDLTNESEGVLVDNFMIMITGRIMLVSLILMIISRMQSSLSSLNKNVGRFWLVRCILDNFFQHDAVHVILGWVGIIIPCLIHIVFILFTPFSVNGSITNKSWGGSSSSSGLVGSAYDYEYHENIYTFEIVRISLALLLILALIFSNCGATFYSLYSASIETINHKTCMRMKSILCNKTFDYGHQKNRYKLFHVLSGVLFLILFYLDSNYIGVYYIVSLFLFLCIIDRLYFLQFNKSTVITTTDLNIIPIDHQFKMLYVNKNKEKMFIEPGDAFYIAENKWSFSRPSIFFSKNNYHSIGCIMRVHRNNTLSCNMERVKWNFNFLEKILDNEIKPIFRGPYRNNIYNRLIWNIQNKKFENKKYIQYLIAVDEGIAYQMEYLTYLQANNFTKMPYPTHIVFATSSKALFNYICTNLQLLFIEIEDLTVECKLLPSNINLIPNIDEMVSYYKNEKIKERNRARKKKLKEQQSKDNYDAEENKEKDEEEQKEENKENVNENEEEEDEKLTSYITETEIMEEMEYEILHYLSIPHILYHHNLKKYYESHPDSKMSHKLQCKYNENHIDVEDEKVASTNSKKENGGIAGLIQPNSNNDKPYNLNSDIQIEMYYSGIPFVSNVLKNVCTICRIPYYTQTIY